MRVIAIVNDRARRGGTENARTLRSLLPRAEVIATRDLEDLQKVADDCARQSPDLVIVAGGDGSAAALLNAFRKAASRAGVKPSVLGRLALLKLGTGNGWANSMGAPPLAFSLEKLRKSIERRETLPFRRFDLVLVEGLIAQFAGTGWDAELIDDFHAQKTARSFLPRRTRQGLVGYLNGLMTRAVPRNLMQPRVEIDVQNLGSPAMGVSSRGEAYELSETRPGGPKSQLYAGPVSVCAVGTTREWGFRFTSMPFAGLVPRRFNFRRSVGPTLSALLRVPALWAGKHPMSNMVNWLCDDVEVRFSRPVPLQAGGDLIGHRDRIRYQIAEEQVDVLDWARLIVPELEASPLSTFAPTALAGLSRLKLV